MRSVVPELLHPSQHCGMPENTIFDAVAAIQDAIADAETTHRPLCVVSLDLKEAFDRISHKYLWTIMRSYGFREGFVERTAMMYDNATSSVQINSQLSTPIQFRCGVRQGCLLSMTLFALCLNPLLYYLDKRLNGISARGRQRKTTVIAYAEDVSILMTSKDEVEIIREAIKCYQKAKGAKLNIEKSSVLAVGNWDTSCDVMGIPYREEITVLGVKRKITVKKSALASWTKLTAMVRTQARRAYSRDLNMAQRITYVQTCLLSKLW